MMTIFDCVIKYVFVYSGVSVTVLRVFTSLGQVVASSRLRVDQGLEVVVPSSGEGVSVVGIYFLFPSSPFNYPCGLRGGSKDLRLICI